MALDPAYLAATGPVTAFVESAAASVGAGMVLGGFFAGLVGTVLGWDASKRDESVVVVGSFAGLGMAVGFVVEAIIS